MSADQPKLPAYVLWFGPTGLSVARALGRAGVLVTALHDDENEPCLDTKYARPVILPPFAENESAWLEWLIEEGRRLSPGKGVLMPASDATWIFIVKNRAALEPYFFFTSPADGDPEKWVGKPFQYACAKRVGVKYPATFPGTNSSDLEFAAGHAKFPCVVKPVLSHLWQRAYNSKLAFARTPQELRRRAGDALERGIAVMIQEYVPSPDNEIYGLFMALDEQSEPLGYCISRKLRQHEPRFGNSCMSQCVNEPRVVELGLRLAKEMGYCGIASAEFKRDPRDGEFKLMEVNLRPTTLMALAADCGVNLPLLMYRHLCERDQAGQSPVSAASREPVTPKKFGRRVGILAQDLRVAAFHHKNEGLSWIRWAWSWIGVRDLYFAWDDRGPFRGYAHTFIDHLRNGRYRVFPANFPTSREWVEGRWDPLQRTIGGHAGRFSESTIGKVDQSSMQRSMNRIVLLVYVLGMLALLMTLFVASNSGRPIDHFFRDPLAVMDAPFYVGLMSNINAMAWFAAAGAAWMMAMMHIATGGVTRRALAIAAMAGMITILGVDDLLMIHEDALQRMLGVSERLTMAVYGLMSCAIALIFRREFAPTPWKLLIPAAAFFAGSILVDVFTTGFGWRLVAEDGLKFFGVVGLMAYVFAVGVTGFVPVKSADVEYVADHKRGSTSTARTA